MRNMFAAGMIGLMVGLTAGAAQAQPPGVTERDGAWIAPDGKPLYTFSRDMNGVSACIERCAANWPPLAAPPEAVADGDWSPIARPDGSKQWAYKGKPLYTYARDAANEAPSGVSSAWPLAVR